MVRLRYTNDKNSKCTLHKNVYNFMHKIGEIWINPKVIVFINTVSKNEIIFSSYKIMSKVSHGPMIYCKKFTMVNADNLSIVYYGVRFCCIMWKLLCAWLLLPHAKHVIVSKWKTVKVLSLCCKQFFIFQRAKELKKYQVMQNLFFGLT